MTVGVALIGAGRIGRVHAANVAGHPGSRLSYVVDVDSDRARALAKQFDAEVGSEDEVFASQDVDAVVIAASTDTHAPLLERAAASGTAAFCEKPIALDLGRVQACLGTIGTPAVPLFVAFNRRFDPNFAALQRRVRAGEIGKVELVSVISKDNVPPPISYVKNSGGLFRDMTIHDFDMARFLLGEEPVRVQALASSVIDPEIGRAGDVDTAVISLITPTGKLAVITNSRRAVSGYDQRLEVHGSAGTLRADNPREDTLTLLDRDGVHDTLSPPFFIERYAASYRAEWDHFMTCVVKGEQPSPSLADGERALALADAALESFGTGRTVVVPQPRDA